MKNICIIGIGGVGGYFGGKMAHFLLSQDSKYHVSFIARGKHLEAIKKNGLLLKSIDGELRCRPSLITDKLSEIPSPDLVMLCIKSYDLVDIAKKLDPVINKNTIILPLLNGVDICERLQKIIHKGIIIPACVYIVGNIEDHGIVRQTGQEGAIVGGKISFNADELLKIMELSHIHFKWIDDPRAAIWEKYLLVASLALVTAFYNIPSPYVLIKPLAMRDALAIMQEIHNLAKAQNIVLSENIIDKTINRIKALGPEARTSFQRDIELKGMTNERDIFGETILKLGNRLGVKTEITEKFHNQIISNLNSRLK